MKWTVPSDLQVPANADVIAFLETTAPSAHSDVASALESAIRGLPGTSTICPDPASYAWVAAHTSGSHIYALAHGQSALCLRVGAERLEAAIGDRGAPAPEIGRDWVRFDLFVVDEPTPTTRARMHRWCTVAFQQAGGAGAVKPR